MSETNHELNVKAAELLGWKWKDRELTASKHTVFWRLPNCPMVWSPATSIEHAMGLLKTMQGDEWRAVFNSVLVTEADIDTFARAITEAFIAATKASK